MANLIKYEFIRKWRGLGIFMAIVLILNAVILIKLQIGMHTPDEQMIALGAFFTGILGVFFILYIIDVTMMYSRDLDHKTGYMFMLTPNSGYKILGSKVITAILEGLLFLLVYLLLLAVNFVGFYAEPLRALVGSDLFSKVISQVHLEGINLTSYFAVNLLMMFVSIVGLFLMIYAAISIRKSILAEKKFGGLISFIIFMLLAWADSAITNTLTTDIFSANSMISPGVPSYTFLLIQILIQVVLGAVFFCVSAYLLENKMDM
ncbi:ABC transporter ATP-binding protein [Dehalobacter restrictus]|uniref:ABC transporter ATP-binding protein n=1 Tax=Dehalobacter restrictus TaxID=55583 RepID=A0A857DHX9_9FIRM|nr:ABC transporter ATP-binding protein [Dehalobacter restrictus]QHA00109.1 ABC transporter ATP-binding protein [Dehalobacter restrictus]